MKRSWAFGAALCFVACRSHPAPSRVSEDAAPRPSASAPAPPPPRVRPSSWRDDSASFALATSCDFVPEHPKAAVPPAAWDIPADPLDCEPGAELGQEPSPCKAGVRACEAPAMKACRSCSTECRRSCERCKSDGVDAGNCGRDAGACLAGCFEKLAASAKSGCIDPMHACMKKQR